MSNSNQQSGEALGKDDVTDLVQSSLNKGLQTMERHRYGDSDTTKLYGLFEMDAAVAAGITSMVTAGGGEITRHLSHRTYSTAVKFGQNIKISGVALEGKALHRTAAAATLAVNLGILLAGPASEFFQALKDHHQERLEATHRVATTLDDYRPGHHSISTFMSIRPQENTVLYAHRKRMHKVQSTKTQNIILTGLGSNLINLFRQAALVESLVTGQHHDIVFNEREGAEQIRKEVIKANGGSKCQLSKESVEAQVRARLMKDEGIGGAQLSLFGGTAGLSMIFNKMAESSERRLNKTLQPYSALEMINVLEDQMQNNPGRATRFQLPHTRKELPLEQYVAEIFKQNMREMAQFDTNYSEIREALNDDVSAIGKLIAQKIQAGDLSPHMLIRLVGEGKIIKSQGRGVASLDEVKEQLDLYAGIKSRAYSVGDLDAFLKDHPYNLDQVKTGLRELQGEERLDYAGMLPDELLAAAGMNDKEIAQVREHRATHEHEVMLAQAAVAMAKQPTAHLKEGNLGNTQITRLQHIAGRVAADQSEETMREVRNGPTNSDGVENIIADYAVSKIAGDKEYLGKMLGEGRAAIESGEVNFAEDGEAPVKGKFADKFAPGGKSHHRDMDFADRDEMGFADREETRGDHHHSRH